ncbi:MAG: YqaE/Pmp3 family membrane protein [Rhizonema sp. NSF051]|nr:YqaE/Pmp3 family membrane protein [Rhizonema sp. NSF051]
MKLLRFVLGLLLPPLGVFLSVGIGPTLLINILLTFLGWLPGSIHAIWVIAKHEETINREGEIY